MACTACPSGCCDGRPNRMRSPRPPLGGGLGVGRWPSSQARPGRWPNAWPCVRAWCGTGWASCARGCGCGLTTSLANSTGSSPSLAASLWDLPGWAAEADRLLTVLDEAESLAQGFIATAEVIRHLLLDPYLPAELLTAGWPGDRLRERYTDFNANYSERLRKYSGG